MYGKCRCLDIDKLKEIDELKELKKSAVHRSEYNLAYELNEKIKKLKCDVKGSTKRTCALL